MRNLKKVCLITGPNINTWPENFELKLLGDFCINDSNKVHIKKRSYSIIEAYGDNFDSRSKDKLYTEELFEKLLVAFSDSLNKIHKVNHPIRYWRILIGPWLNAIIPVLYNRWNKINLALNFSTDEIISARYPLKSIIPYDMADFIYMHLRPEWNSDIFSRILQFKNIDYDPYDFPSKDIKHNEINRNNLVQKIRSYFINLIQFISYKNDSYFFITSYIPRKKLFLLQMLLGQFPVFHRSKNINHIKPDISLRKRFLIKFDYSNDFESFLISYLKYALPSIYCEGFGYLNEVVSSMSWPKNPKKIFTSNSFFSDEVFKKWTADKVLQGSKYIIGQHGGGYATKEFPQRTELHEQYSSDLWLSWGAFNDSRKSVLRATNLKLIGKKRFKKNLNNSLLLQITDDLFPYSRFPWCSDEFNKVYMDNQIKFAKTLSRKIQDSLTVRLHSNQSQLGIDQNHIWNKRAPKINIDQGYTSIDKLISKSRIIVSTYNSTSYLETLSLNIPTVMFWDIDKSPINKRAQPFFDLLLECDIFHTSPESASKHVSSIWENVYEWWDSDEVQDARLVFCRNFSLQENQPILLLRNIISQKNIIDE